MIKKLKFKNIPLSLAKAAHDCATINIAKIININFDILDFQTLIFKKLNNMDSEG